MDDLNQTQIILLAILVSFVTSIGTGIITVSLLDEAPPQFTQTINKVVERTIERVSVPEEEREGGSQEVIRETIVVKEEDQVVDVIDSNRSSMVRLALSSAEQSEEPEILGLGVIVNSSGAIVVDGSLVSQTGKYLAITEDDNRFEVETVRDPDDTVAVLKPLDSNNIDLPFSKLSSIEVKLGQTVVALGGLKSLSVDVGIVTDLISKPKEQATTTDQTVSPDFSSVGTVVTDAVLSGADTEKVFLNLSGEVVGIHLSGQNPGVFIPSSVIKKALSEVTAFEVEKEKSEVESTS